MSVDGRVSAGGEVLVPVTVHSGNETAREIEALVDTGFNGGLALPARHIEELELSLVGRERMLLASGDLSLCADVPCIRRVEGEARFRSRGRSGGASCRDGTALGLRPSD
jgi:hypothetical protein